MEFGTLNAICIPHHSWDPPLHPAQISNRLLKQLSVSPASSATPPFQARSQGNPNASSPLPRRPPAGDWGSNHLALPPPLPLPQPQATSLSCWVLRQLMSPASPCPPAPREMFREGKAGHLTPLLKSLQQFPLHLARRQTPALGLQVQDHPFCFHSAHSQAWQDCPPKLSTPGSTKSDP